MNARKDKPRIAIVLRYGLNPDAWGRRHANGELVDPTPYGYQLADGVFDLTWSHDHAENALARIFRQTVRRIAGFDLVHVWRNRAIIREADAVWTHTEREHLGVAALAALRPRRYRAVSVAQSVWLWDQWPAYAGPRKWILRRLLQRHAVELTLSAENAAASMSTVPGRVVVRVPFGTHLADPADPARVTPVPARVLTIGNDRHRDWSLLCEVSGRLPEIDFDVISLSPSAREQEWPGNVEIRSTTQRDILDSAYANATLVCLPLTPNLHASGCTVAIEAVSAGLPIVATDVGGIRDYLEGSQAQLVPPGDASAFVAAIVAALNTPPSKQASAVARERGLTEADYVNRLVSITLSLIDGEPLDSMVSEFSPMPHPVATRADRTAGLNHIDPEESIVS